MENICVAVRVRPSRNEESSPNGFHWTVESNRISLHRSDDTPINALSFAFDHILDQDCTNARVYELLTKNIIHSAVDGFNGTAFAYGQTSSGKTFTMNGSESDPGIIHRAVKDIFAKIHKTSDREFLIRVSYMEIYNEEINDLFAVENQKLQIHESLDRGVFVAGLREEIVNNADQVLNLIQLGEVNRHFGDTNMNARSSRSHTIFRMVIESKVKDDKSANSSSSDDVIRVSVLNLVDLAGSERIAKTGAGGVRLKEGKHINKSLMILGNVINKLSEGGKQRAHIPYRDSKLTRILQPALGGNAKTSIICTVAPEEIHVEETKGTLQFASRAKRITNCVQVNEILTDGALLKRQKLEIEDLRRRLQGSHAEVLEQEILKLRNDMLKYELEREKLAAELKEERKSQREREQCIREQQMKIDNLSNLVSLSDTDRSTPRDYIKHHNVRQQNTFSTPCYKANSNVFVAKRSHNLTLPDSSSPLPDAFGHVVDEDTWAKMNKGFIADLDSIHMTPARKVQSFPYSEDYSTKNGDLEMLDLQTQLKFVTEERDELKRKHAEQVLFNDQLIREISELQQEIEQIQEIPRNLNQAVTSCKDIYDDIFSVLQNLVDDEKSTTAQILSTMSDIGTCLLSTLESHLSIAVYGKRRSSMPDFSTREQCDKLREKLTCAVSSLVSDTSSSIPGAEQRVGFFRTSKTKGNLGEQISCWKSAVKKEVDAIKQKHDNLEKELDHKNLLMEISEAKYHSLEREFRLVREDRDALLQKISDSSQTIAHITGENDRVLKDFNREVSRRKNLEHEIKQFSLDFASRKKSIISLQSDFKSILENMNPQSPASSLSRFH